MRRTGKWWMPTAAAIIALVAVLAFWLSCGGSKSTSSTSTSPTSPTTPSSPSSPSSVDVATYHDDVARTGENTNETTLTPSNVNSTKFGKVAFLSTDGKVDAEPLYLSQISMPSQGMRNVLYVATENDTVYAFNVTPNGNEGAIWMSGAGPAADSAGNIYFLQANGTFDTTLNTSGFPNQGDFGNSFMKLSTSSGLSVADYFTMSNTMTESDADQDLGSGGALVLPDMMDSGGNVHHLAVGAGKDQIIYVVNRDSMGKFSPSANNIYQEIQGQLSGQVFSMPAYFNNTVYYGAVGDTIKAFPISNAKLATTPSNRTATSFVYPGATPSVSANGTSNGIIWAVENASTAVLHAYDATNLANELYNSNQAAAGRDHFGTGNKFITPMIVNGKVYVGTTNGVAVFGPIS